MLAFESSDLSIKNGVCKSNCQEQCSRFGTSLANGAQLRHNEVVATSLPVTTSDRPSPRERVRAEVTREILTVAKQHLGTFGAPALSLRAVARDVGMVSSAVYRYFPSRDDLLTALIVDGFEQIALTVEAADASVPATNFRARWSAVGNGVRSWALQHPHEYGLIYGTPIPGYVAPVDTVVPVERTAITLVSILQDGVRLGVITSQPRSLSKAERAAMAPMKAAYPDLPIDVFARGLQSWMALIGMITFELFGHLNNVVSEPSAFFNNGLDRLADLVIGADSQRLTIKSSVHT